MDKSQKPLESTLRACLLTKYRHVWLADSANHRCINPTIFNINTLGCWVTGTNDSSPKRLMFQVLFFSHCFLQNSLQKLFQFIFLFFYNFTEIKIKSFECPKSIRNYKKNNAWNIDAWSTSHLSQWTSMLYCRLSDFNAISINAMNNMHNWTWTKM